MLSNIGGGRGGPGDIFKIGKSNIKKVNKVIRSKLFIRGCTTATTHGNTFLAKRHSLTHTFNLERKW